MKKATLALLFWLLAAIAGDWKWLRENVGGLSAIMRAVVILVISIIIFLAAIHGLDLWYLFTFKTF